MGNIPPRRLPSICCGNSPPSSAVLCSTIYFLFLLSCSFVLASAAPYRCWSLPRDHCAKYRASTVVVFSVSLSLFHCCPLAGADVTRGNHSVMGSIVTATKHSFSKGNGKHKWRPLATGFVSLRKVPRIEALIAI